MPNKLVTEELNLALEHLLSQHQNDFEKYYTKENLS